MISNNKNTSIEFSTSIDNIENLKDKKVILEVLEKLQISYTSHKYFTDGADSRVILLNNKYLIKQNEISSIKAEIEFFENTFSTFFQKLVYYSPCFEFVVYEFIPGKPMKKISNSKEIISKILEVSKSFSPTSKPGFGYLGEEFDSWSEFLSHEAFHRANIDNIDKNTVLDAIKTLEKYPFEKKLIHGDFGTHNFIENDGKFVGIIDPQPIIGDSLYDILFAICSNVSLLTTYKLDEIYVLINEPKEKVNAMLIVVLYARISRALKYHPNDIPTYLDFLSSIC